MNQETFNIALILLATPFVIVVVAWGVTDFIDEIPVIGRYGWYIILFELLIMILRLRKIIGNMLKPPVRLPGDLD